MKRNLIVAVLALSASFAFAQETAVAATEGSAAATAATARQSPLAIDVGAGIAWSQRYDTGTLWLDIPFGLRGGFWGDIMYRSSDVLELGVEAGVYYMQWDGLDGATVFLGDFPICLKVSLDLGIISLDALSGAMITVNYASGINLYPNMMAGARLFIGQVFAEADYVLQFTVAAGGQRKAYPRFALGYKLPVK